MNYMRAPRIVWAIVASIVVVIFPLSAYPCACGCNVFSVGARWMMPLSAGLRISLTYDYMDQNENWNDLARAPLSLNPDRRIRTSFYTFSSQYMIDRNWGITAEAPIWTRYFSTTIGREGIASVSHTSFADMRILGMYTGISEDMSTGIEFGLKLPTGPFNLSLMDRDTQIGTGTTDLLLGAYQMGQLGDFGWYTQAMWQHPLDLREGYRPGDSFDMTLGIDYNDLLESYHIVPLFQIIASFKGSDSGANSDPANTGYTRLYVSPGVEVNIVKDLQLYADLRLPVLTRTTGYQLVAPALLEVTLGYQI